MRLDATGTDLRPVLVVEDSDDDFDTMLIAAARANVRNPLVRAADADAARRLLATDTAGSFAFMLLDHNLPGPDGLALLDQVRRDGSLAGLPVVVFSTSVNPGDRARFLEAGAGAFHVKSVQYTDCLGTLESIFRHWLNGAPPPNDAAVSSSTRRPA
jgi:two-component system, chemotaxis family, chemotaxis protein CheY